MKKSLDNKQYPAALLTDLSKAFDCINHELIIAKLDAYGFDYSSLIYMHSYLSERKQRTKVNNSYSSWSTPSTGVPQGSIMGPPVFNIDINDLFYLLEDNNLANYADDNTPHETGECLECVLKCIEDDALILLNWFENDYYKMNADKCHLLVPKNKREEYANINGEIIKSEESVKLIGLSVDKNLDFKMGLQVKINYTNFQYIMFVSA